MAEAQYVRSKLCSCKVRIHLPSFRVCPPRDSAPPPSKKSALVVCCRWAPDFDGDTDGSLKLVPLGVAGLTDAERLARIDAHIEWLFTKRRLVANRLAIADKTEEIAVADKEVKRMREWSVKAKVPAGVSQGVDDF